MKKMCEILKTGTFTDSKGTEHTYTADDLDKIADNFKNVHNRVPICVGHPQSNTPAYGWFDEVKRVDNGLFASFKNVQDGFKKAINEGLFKNRSISLDGNLNIRHLAFLGGQAPAIKGLEEFCFEDGENFLEFETENNFDFSDNENASKANERENDLELQEMEKQLAEKEAENKKLKDELEAKKQAEKIKDYEDFCDKAIEKGNLLPKHKKGVVNILTACDSVEKFDFADSEDETAVDAVKTFISDLKVFDFKPIADKNDADAVNFEDFDAEMWATEIQKTKDKSLKNGLEITTAEAVKQIKNGRI